ncbi:MAG: diaminopimelate decarboxylase [Halodesulfurarchaeum sp.]
MTKASAPVRRLDDWSADLLREVAAESGTPTYVIDLDRVEENYRRLAAAFEDASIHYAAKANAGSAVLSRLESIGAGVECATAGELRRAVQAGFEGDDLLYTPVNPPGRDLDVALEIQREHPGLTITVGSGDTLDRLASRGYTGRIAVRVHPGVGSGHGPAVATGGDAKFGVPPETALDLLEKSGNRGMNPVGIHAHVGSGILDAGDTAYREMVETLGDVAERAEPSLEFVDVGGGFGVPYRPSEDPLDVERLGGRVREALGELVDRGVSVKIEPGRYLVADAGVLLARVNTVKPIMEDTHPVEGQVLAGVDAGMTDLLRPALYDAAHEVRNLDPGAGNRETVQVSVVGPICESTDVLAADRRLPRPSRGDLLAIGNAGAYGIEMANNYNSRPRPPVVAIEGGELTLVRRRETIDDITDPEVRR